MNLTARVRRPTAATSWPPPPDALFDAAGTASAADLNRIARLPPADVLRELGSGDAGLCEVDAVARLSQHGINHHPSGAARTLAGWLWTSVASPFTVLLLALDAVMAVTGDTVGMVLLSTAVLASLTLRLLSEHRFDHVTAMLTDLSTPRVRVLRSPGRGRWAMPVGRSCNRRLLVPGDVILLEAGDVIPADCRIITAEDLTVDQATLTGESVPVAKYVTLTDATAPPDDDVLHASTLCLTGSSVATGHATAVVVKTGPATLLAATVRRVAAPRRATAADLGLRAVTWLLIRLLAALVPAVFTLTVLAGNGIGAAHAALFAVAVAVGLVPELLPVILAAANARGLSALANRRIIVTRSAAIQDLAGMDVLCVDKTGTLTHGQPHLHDWLSPDGDRDEHVLEYAVLAAGFATDQQNRLDRAILERATPLDRQVARAQYERVAELAFNTTRRRGSVILDPGTGGCLMITKGAVTDVLAVCATVRRASVAEPLTEDGREQLARLCAGLWHEGMRLLAVAYRDIDPADGETAEPGWETELTLAGFLAFTDPVKPDAGHAIADLAERGVRTVVVTGDARDVAVALCSTLGIPAGQPVTGAELDTLDEPALLARAAQTTVFSDVSPVHKARVVRALRAAGHVVGFLGDGVNDTPALRAADVGLAVTDAAPVARLAADAVLLDKDLRILTDGVVTARHATLNATKYLKATLSANLGNVLSVLYAAVALPFLPMLPIQLLVQNVCYDLAQLTLPLDHADPEQLRRPQRWSGRDLLIFIACFAPLSSVFDVAAFALLRNAGQLAFHTGWFVESLLTQILAVHVIRTGRLPVLRSRAAMPVAAAALAGCTLALALPMTGVGAALGLTPLPATVLTGIALIVIGYLVCLQAAKVLYRRLRRRWL